MTDLIVITGGSSGIGAATAVVIAETGRRVVVVDMNSAVASPHPAILYYDRSVDVSDQASVRAAARAIETKFGPVSGLVNAAGILGKMHVAEKIRIENWNREFDVDLRGTFLAAREFARFMLQRGRGSIVNIASIAGLVSAPAHAYAAAKAGVIQLTTTLAAEWGPRGVRVNAVSPGFTRTAALEAGMQSGVLDPTLMTQHAALGRLVEPAEIGRAIAFLIGPESSAITGINLPVDAGWLCGSPWEAYGGLRKGSDERR
jgi:NAD(P)-dependent dehydrogenase (short-subunit alcohol dehydrogenase family)